MGREMIIIKCPRYNGGIYVPINIFIIQKRQEECYCRSREKGDVSCCGDKIKYS